MKKAFICWSAYQLINIINYVNNTRNEADINDIILLEYSGMHSYEKSLIKTDLFNKVIIAKQGITEFKDSTYARNLKKNNIIYKIKSWIFFLKNIFCIKRNVLNAIPNGDIEYLSSYSEIFATGWAPFFIDFALLNRNATVIFLEDGMSTYLGDSRDREFPKSGSLSTFLLRQKAYSIKVKYRYVIMQQVNELLSAVKNFTCYKFIFLGSNADTSSDIIRNSVKKFVSEHGNTIYFENLHTDAYHYLLKNGICLIGNSSSGLIEAPSLGIYTINIGNRQAGRIRGNSVIDTECNHQSIESAIHSVIDSFNKVKIDNPYYMKDSARLYYETTKKLLKRIPADISEPKQFYDLK